MMPAHVEAWTNRGTVLQELGRSAEALLSFDRALALTPLHVTRAVQPRPRAAPFETA